MLKNINLGDIQKRFNGIDYQLFSLMFHISHGSVGPSFGRGFLFHTPESLLAVTQFNLQSPILSFKWEKYLNEFFKIKFICNVHFSDFYVNISIIGI